MLSTIGPATPDHTIYTKRLPCFARVDDPRDPTTVTPAIKASVERFVADYTGYFNSYNTGGAVVSDAFPRVITVAGLGMFTTGKDRRTAGIVSDIYHHTISVLGAATPPKRARPFARCAMASSALLIRSIVER